jgi:hypothetical protein
MKRTPPLPGCQNDHVPEMANFRRPPTPCVTGTAMAKHARASAVKMSRAAGVAYEWCAVMRSAVPASASNEHAVDMTVVPVLLKYTRDTEGRRLWRERRGCPRWYVNSDDTINTSEMRALQIDAPNKSSRVTLSVPNTPASATMTPNIDAPKKNHEKPWNTMKRFPPEKKMFLNRHVFHASL